MVLVHCPVPSTKTAKLRVLIVDDQDYIRRGLRALVGRATNFEFCGEAEDGKDAVVKAMDLKPDVVLMDIGLPGMNGLDATREIVRLVPKARVITVSQYELPHIVRESSAAGAITHVSKLNLWADLMPALLNLQPR